METPRKNRLDLNIPAEMAIYNAIQEVEKLGAAPKLTEVVEMLSNSKELLSEYVDSKQDEVELVKHFNTLLENRDAEISHFKNVIKNVYEMNIEIANKNDYNFIDSEMGLLLKSNF